MKKLLFIFIPFLLLTFTSCITNKMLVSNVKPTEINELAYFEPESYIQLIEKGNHSKLNDSLSTISKENLEKILIKYKNSLKLTDKINITNDTLNNRIQNEINYLIQFASRNKTIKGVKLTPLIDSVMKANHQRFALAIASVGFGRKKGNYGGQIAKGIGIGILTLGMYIQEPIKSNIMLYGIIFDSQNDEVSFYKNTKPLEKSPTDIEIIDKQFQKLFMGYFFHEAR